MDQGKISTKFSYSTDLALFYPPLVIQWNKITTLNEDSHNLVECNYLKLATKNAPRTRQIWAAILASIQLPTGIAIRKGEYGPPLNAQEDVDIGM